MTNVRFPRAIGRRSGVAVGALALIALVAVVVAVGQWHGERTSASNPVVGSSMPTTTSPDASPLSSPTAPAGSPPILRAADLPGRIRGSLHFQGYVVEPTSATSAIDSSEAVTVARRSEPNSCHRETPYLVAMTNWRRGVYVEAKSAPVWVVTCPIEVHRNGGNGGPGSLGSDGHLGPLVRVTAINVVDATTGKWLFGMA